MNVQDLFDTARHIESAGYTYYSQLAEKLSPETNGLFPIREIISEEKSHLANLLNQKKRLT